MSTKGLGQFWAEKESQEGDDFRNMSFINGMRICGGEKSDPKATPLRPQNNPLSTPKRRHFDPIITPESPQSAPRASSGGVAGSLSAAVAREHCPRGTRAFPE